MPNDWWFVFGYDVTAIGGLTTYTGVYTWGWWNGAWDLDMYWNRTAVMEVAADYYTSPVEIRSWSAVKSLFK